LEFAIVLEKVEPVWTSAYFWLHYQWILCT